VPITSTVCQIRNETGSETLDLSSATPRLSRSWQTEFQVIFDGATVPSDVDAMQAMSQTGVPVIGETVYVNPVSGFIRPYLIATSKSAERDSINPYRYVVTVDYTDESPTDAGEVAPPTDPEELDPLISWAIEESTETAWSEDPSVEDPGPEECVLPTGMLYASPTTRKSCAYVATVTQYENSFNLNKIRERIYGCNKDIWQGFDPYQAQIANIDWQYVRMPLSGGGFQYTYKIAYTIKCKQYELKNLKDDGTVEDRTVGWEQVRIRADSVVNTIADDPTSRVLLIPKNPASVGPIYMKSNGLPHQKSKQGGIPPLDFFRSDPQINFKTGTGKFLRV